jgi:nitrite reductase/ring-hydroxylating ferredoxin subunit
VSDAQASALDLRGGVEQAAIAEGRLICGSFYGQPVLIARHRGRYCAVSATCTHLGGPLGEGIMVDGRVHCPWHHARFSVETGEAVAAPAFEPLVRFGTLVRDGRVFVTERLSEPIAREAAPIAPGPVVMRAQSS